MTRSAKLPRCVKAARRALKKAATSGPQQRGSKSTQPSSLDAVEADNQTQRLARRVETKKRNAGAQELPRSKRRKKTKLKIVSTFEERCELDRKAFFDCIDDPLLRVCGSCGELANSANAVLKLFDPDGAFYDPLRNDDGQVEIVEEGLVCGASKEDQNQIWLCDRCNRAIRSRKTPKFCRASGFRLGDVPDELAVLNRMEARLVGLGISFTTCVNLYRDGQEFTRGNAINYWNEPGEVVRELPRPLKSCGIVFLAAKSDKATNYFRVRPWLVRRALCWLINNNPLYENISISEQNLQALEDMDLDQEIPSLPVTDEDVQELRGHVQQMNSINEDSNVCVGTPRCSEAVNLSPHMCSRSMVSHNSELCGSSSLSDEVCATNTDVFEQTMAHSTGRRECAHDCEAKEEDVDAGISSEGEHCDPRTDTTCSKEHACDTGSTIASLQNASCSTDCTSSGDVTSGWPNDEDVMDNLTESYELEGNHNSKKSELEHILSAVGVDSPHLQIPMGELRCQQDPIDEYQTKQLMQCCFPTLFPHGLGGYHPLDGKENRLHEYKLSEFCAHLMKWHDRRFIIHGNFKFFCMNLIQRRQIDGLVRRVCVTDSRTAAINAAGCGRNHQTTSDEQTSKNEKEELSAALQVLESLKPYFRVVRGSGLYWSNARDDLMAMIGNRVMPTRWPTFFLTLSAADTIWPDFARACNPSLTLDECRDLSYVERRKLLNENPDISARHFNRRFQAFFDKVLCGASQPLGEIVDHFWRVEFQQRGSPHIHCLLWIKGAPDVLKLSETDEGRSQLAAYVDKHISVLAKTLTELDECLCTTCCTHRDDEVDILALRPPSVTSVEWECDLARIVQRVQQHVCYANSSCRKKSNECRFGFPKQLQAKTTIETKVGSDGTPSLKVHLKRDVSSINNYSPHLLSSWRANMDLQLIGNSYGAAEYAGAYISKAEPDTLRFRRVIAKAVQRCDPNLPYHSILKRVANATLSVREVGAPEAIYILLRSLPMHSKSRSVVKVKVLRHLQRFYRVEPQGLEELASLADTATSSDTIKIEPIERAYMNRPTNELFDCMSFATFVEEYEIVDTISDQSSDLNTWARIDAEGWIKRRRKSVVVQKSPWMRCSSANPNFCFSEVFLYVPWRSLDDLPVTDEECIAYFFDVQEQQLDGELQQESNAKLARQHKLDLLKSARDSCNAASFAPSEYVFISNAADDQVEVDQAHVSDPSSQPDAEVEWKSRHEYSSATVAKARDFLGACLKPWLKERKDLRKLGSLFHGPERTTSRYEYPLANSEQTQHITETMHESQWIPFALAMEQSRRRLKCSLEKSSCKPLRMIINGEGGSGKSWLIRHIVKDLHNVFGEHSSTRRTSKRVLLLAHQGTAAFNIKGRTLCSAFGFSSFSKSAFSIPYKSLTETKSGPANLKRMQQEFRDVHLVIIDEFSMISCGMLYWIDQRMREIWPDHSDEPFGGRDIYFTGDAAQLDPVVPSSLSTPLSKISNPVQRRGREIWASIENVCMLTSQNRGKHDPEWFSALRRLRQKAPTQADIDLFNTRCLSAIGEPEWSSKAKHIAYKNVDVAAANNKNISLAKHPIVNIKAQHFVQQKRLATKRTIPTGTVQALVKDAQTPNSDHDRVVANSLKLCIGAPVTLTFNLAQPAGLCNGTNALVYDFMFISGSDLPIVLIQITDPYLGPSLLDGIPNIVPIAAKEISWGKESSDLRVVRRGIPLRLAYAMTVHKVQGLTCSFIVFHSNSIPNIAFAYVALSRIQHRNAIVITHKLRIEKFTASAEKIAEFEREENRVSEVVLRTARAAKSAVQRMQTVALAHNSAVGPR